MPSVLLTNDDGIHSPPLRALWKALLDAEVGEVAVVVPEREMSAAGKGITLHKPLRLMSVYAKLGRGRYGLAHLTNGTPGDCVMLALKWILGERPDVVASGINMGDNITVDNVFTSGTIAGAVEAVLQGIPAAAFSSEVPSDPKAVRVSAFEPHAAIAAEVVSWMLEEGLPEGVDLLNVNFPFRISDDTPVVLTRLGWTKFRNFILERVDPRGRPYYWIGSDVIDVGEQDEGTDIYALTVERAISITPLRLDNTFRLDVDEEWMREELERAARAREKLQDLVDRLSPMVAEVKRR